jgi:hypothetical protein
MNQSAFEDNIYIAFLIQRLFQLPGQRKVIGHWMAAIPKQSTVESALSLSVQSLATSFFGRVHRQPVIMERGVQLYGAALGGLSHLLQDPQRCWSFEALACANALELYEVGAQDLIITRQVAGMPNYLLHQIVTYSVTFGWLRHAGGIGRLIESRGPWRHKELSERKVFQESRIYIVRHSAVFPVAS